MALRASGLVGNKTLHEVSGCVCDLCGKVADSEVSEVTALDCSYQNCDAMSAIYHQACLEKFLKAQKCERPVAVAQKKAPATAKPSILSEAEALAELRRKLNLERGAGAGAGAPVAPPVRAASPAPVPLQRKRSMVLLEEFLVLKPGGQAAGAAAACRLPAWGLNGGEGPSEAGAARCAGVDSDDAGAHPLSAEFPSIGSAGDGATPVQPRRQQGPDATPAPVEAPLGVWARRPAAVLAAEPLPAHARQVPEAEQPGEWEELRPDEEGADGPCSLDDSSRSPFPLCAPAPDAPPPAPRGLRGDQRWPCAGLFAGTGASLVVDDWVAGDGGAGGWREARGGLALLPAPWVLAPLRPFPSC
ncbi:hypothetical protein APUTEX25_000264 [Auxenochlorella protothecoides]|uniref:Uncharacterized protein n=1 Tax=Auxenochlorella protothecoides TaxID=3075 RepID=A0A3M7KYX6_AUXPR|nr:hypothetical protein APUTEX25_000264 [Auxenochlorella protothecoides]|eukprot:RMZ55681.1 hypothetical protein APUTEX25_000264 [Auxenochlorella protothecoides]